MEMTRVELEEVRAGQRMPRLDLMEEKQRLEDFANPQDAFEEVHPADAEHDRQIRNFRQLARINQYLSFG